MELCLVCGNETHGANCGAQTCRACCAFFRRTIIEKRVYTCKKDGTCEISHDLRNTCRACRLKKCYGVGLEKRLANASISSDTTNIADCTIGCFIHDSPEYQVQSISSTPSPIEFKSEYKNGSPVMSHMITMIQPTPLEPYDKSATYPTLNRLLTGIRTFLNSQKSLMAIEKSMSKIQNNEFTMIIKSKYDTLEKGCISLTYSMFNDYYESFANLEHEHKIELMKTLSLKFTIIYKCYLTARHFPSYTDNRIMTHFGYIVDLTNTDYFFTEPNKELKIWPCIRDGMHYLRRLANKFAKYEISEIDIGALNFLIYSNECEKFNIDMTSIEHTRNSVFRELLGHYLSGGNFDQGSVKYSNVLNLVHDVDEIRNTLHECYTVGKIFDPSLCYVWEDCC